MKRLNSLILLICFALTASAQSHDKTAVAISILEADAENLGLSKADVKDVLVTDSYTSKHNGVTHVYLNQTFKGIPVYEAHSNYNITKENKVAFSRNEFVPNLKSKIVNTDVSINAEQALTFAARNLDIPITKALSVKTEISENQTLFNKQEISKYDILVEKKYYKNEAGKYILTWDLKINKPSDQDYYEFKIDGTNGEVLDKYNHTKYCKVHNHKANAVALAKDHECVHEEHQRGNTLLSSMAAASGSYNAYIFPAESPIHGVQSIADNPHYPEASPLGWHDDDGNEGAEYTFTRGNNVHAFADLDGDGFSSGDEPDGGADLNFDFPHEVTAEADVNHDAATVNLFYAVNYLHDLLYIFGWDEAAGAAQYNQYGATGGQGFDHVIAREADPGIADNASAVPTGDGNNPFISMGVWTSGENVLNVNSPSNLSGPATAQQPTAGADGTWGILWSLDVVDVTGNVVEAFDGTAQFPQQCCEDIVSDNVLGNIALIERGTCEFGTKAFNAQEAGAIAVIVCNVTGVNGGNGEELVNMSGGDDGPEVNIPAIFVPKSFCDRVKLELSVNNDVNLTISNQFVIPPPTTFSSSFDNVVIAHEIGHIINGRLVGGPNSPAGLQNGEQMGEGWSDFFGVALTVEEGDTAEDPRGVGTYLLKENPEGVGIRRFPYSRDMAVNPLTYNDIIGINEVHGIGEVWAAMMWDMYWNFIDLYGFDPTWTDETSGNWQGMQLCMDGLKFVGTNPGFEDARNAILASDEVNNGGVNRCMIWETFARRGLGFFADQGDTNDPNDGVENFEPLPTCIEELKITKTSDEFIEPGDNIKFSLLVQNHTLDDATNVVATDILPDGTSLVTASIMPTISGNTMTWDLGTMATLEETTITYELSTLEADKSDRLYYDDIENINNSWIVDFQNAEGFNLWSRTQLETNSGDFAWYVEEVEGNSRQSLIFKDLVVSGANPALRFYHKYNTVAGIDGGYIEISNDGGSTWRIVNDEFFRNGYPRSLDYTTFAIPSLNAYSGDSGAEWVDSYIDLRDYNGQNVDIKFRFGTDEVDETPLPPNFPGWYVDDFELLDMLIHETEACVNSDQSAEDCSQSTTIVNTGEISSLSEANVEGYDLSIFPNPADDFITVSLSSEFHGNSNMSISTVDGRTVYSNNVKLDQPVNMYNINVKAFAAGFYILRLDTNNGVITRKLVIE